MCGHIHILKYSTHPSIITTTMGVYVSTFHSFVAACSSLHRAEARNMHRENIEQDTAATTPVHRCPSADTSGTNTEETTTDPTKRRVAHENAKDFYRNILLFLERKWNSKLQAHISGDKHFCDVDEALQLVLFVRKYAFWSWYFLVRQFSMYL